MRPVRTLLPVLLAHLCRHPAAAQEGGPGCDCAGCGSSSTKILGLHETLLGIVNAADAASDEEFVLEGSQDSAPESSVIAVRR